MQASTVVHHRRGTYRGSQGLDLSTKQETYTAALPATGYVRLPVVAAVCGIAKSTVWSWAAKGTFPQPIKLSSRVSAWPVAQVRAWLADPAAWKAAHSA